MTTPSAASGSPDGTDNGPVARFRHISESMGFLLWKVSLAWQRAIRAALDPHELTHVQFVLLASVGWLGESEETPTQQRIAEHLGVDTMMTSQVLRRLAARQLISRELDERDARARRVVLTDAGRALLTEARADVEATDIAFFAALGPEAPAFMRGLTLLRDE